MTPRTDAARFVSETAIGARVVVRTTIDGGYTDALGYLRSCDESACVVETRRGLVTLALDDVVAAKEVPPPPPRRAPRHPLG